MDSLYRQLEKRATITMIVFILVGCLLCILGFAWRNNKLAAGLPADEKTALDGRFYDLKKNRFLYGPQEVDALFTNLEKNQNLQLYAITEITLDLVFPLLYTLLDMIPYGAG